MKLFLAAFLSLFALNSFSQTNLTLQSQTDYDALHNTRLNDIWGYVDENNNEYALVGARKGTSIVDVTNPSAPNEVFWLPGMQSIWRDLKTWGDYCYVTTEAEQGLTIIDMSPLPASTTLSPTLYFGPSGNEWESAHNLYIDENGYAYIFGANRGNGGVIILDVATDPLNPIEVGEFDNWYCHDGYVRNDTMYLAHIYEGIISVVDVTDKANPVLLGTQNTPSNFSHNIWLSDDGDFVFTTDEVGQAYIAAYDVSDPANIFEVDRIQNSPGTGTIPHNAHVLGDFLITSHYADGLVIHDISDPYNMVQVGEFDTHIGQEASTTGNWGAYPYLPSGVVLATDIETGLYVLQPNYEYAARLEGLVRDASTLNDLSGVAVQIVSHNQVEITDLAGEYKTGILAGGTYDVTYSKVAYFPQTVSVNLTQGNTITQNIDLVPIPPFSLTVNVTEVGTGNPIIGADIRLEHTLITHSDATNGLGQADFDLFYEDFYNVTVGKWGYETFCSTQTIDASTGTINIELKPGIYDDFSFDFGWTASGSATSGNWVRAIPFGTGDPQAPENADEDSQNDCGKHAFVTGNTNNPNSDIDDVDEGSVALLSPVFDLTSYSDPYIYYERWFFNNYGPGAIDDTLTILVSDGTQTVVIDKVGSDPATFHQWIPKNIKLSDYVNLTASMQVFVTTSDFDPDVNITEAGFDNFRITEGNTLDLDDEVSEELELIIYPNPTSGIINFNSMVAAQDIMVLDLMGKVVWKANSINPISVIDVSSLPASTYFIKINNQTKRFIKF